MEEDVICINMKRLQSSKTISIRNFTQKNVSVYYNNLQNDLIFKNITLLIFGSLFFFVPICDQHGYFLKLIECARVNGSSTGHNKSKDVFHKQWSLLELNIGTPVNTHYLTRSLTESFVMVFVRCVSMNVHMENCLRVTQKSSSFETFEQQFDSHDRNQLLLCHSGFD